MWLRKRRKIGGSSCGAELSRLTPAAPLDQLFTLDLPSLRLSSLLPQECNAILLWFICSLSSSSSRTVAVISGGGSDDFDVEVTFGLKELSTREASPKPDSPRGLIYP